MASDRQHFIGAFAIVLDMGGYILAGGASSRMGTDKASLVLGRETFVERIGVALRSIAKSIYVVSSHHSSAEFRLPVVPDIHRNRGAMGGLHAALSHTEADWIAVVSCDLPFVTAPLFERLTSLSQQDFDAVAPIQSDGRPQPLCALYRTSTCLEVVNALISARELKPRELLSRVRTRWVSFEELSDLEDSDRLFTNVNTPEDYERIQRTNPNARAK